jgi:hypothetical protein
MGVSPKPQLIERLLLLPAFALGKIQLVAGRQCLVWVNDVCRKGDRGNGIVPIIKSCHFLQLLLAGNKLVELIVRHAVTILVSCSAVGQQNFTVVAA